MASRQAKDLAAQVMGERYRNGLYRLAYNGISMVLTIWLTVWVLRLPNKELYRVPPPFSWVMRLAQMATLAVAIWTILVIGLPRFAGFTEAIALLTGSEVEPEPEAQGPPLASNGEMKAEGAFAYTRHPANWVPFGLFLFSPRMTVNAVTLAVLYVIYVLLGSWHEDVRLRQVYGEAYERYREKVPFLFPRL